MIADSAKVSAPGHLLLGHEKEMQLADRLDESPVVEVDTEAHAAYIRFNDNAVVETQPRTAEECLVTVDLDSNGEVIGIELVGVEEFRLDWLLEKAGVSPLAADLLQRARYVPAPRRTELVAD